MTMPLSDTQKTLDCLAAALQKAAGFIENVNDDTPNRTQLFFEAREAWREAFEAYQAVLTNRVSDEQKSAANLQPDVVADCQSRHLQDHGVLVKLTKPQREKLLGLIVDAAAKEPGTLMKALEEAVSTPFEVNVAVGIEGDWPQGASANCPMNLVVLDHDLDEAHPDHARLIPPLVDPDEALALVNRAFEKEVDDEAARSAAPRD